MSERAESDRIEERAFENAKKPFVIAVAAIAAGLAVAGTLDSTAGGVVVVVGWLVAIASLHRLGRAGSVRAAREPRSRS